MKYFVMDPTSPPLELLESFLIENMNYHLILLPNLAEKLILHRNHLPNFTENLGSNLIQDAQLLTNIGMKLLS